MNSNQSSILHQYMEQVQVKLNQSDKKRYTKNLQKQIEKDFLYLELNSAAAKSSNQNMNSKGNCEDSSPYKNCNEMESLSIFGSYNQPKVSLGLSATSNSHYKFEHGTSSNGNTL